MGVAEATTAPRVRGRIPALLGRFRLDAEPFEGAIGGRTVLFLVAASLAVAALTLLFPSTPTYDPWSWIIWGKEILHLDLDTVGGPSWKPLPVLFTVPFSIFGDAAPDLWLVVARAGGILALAMAFRLAWRLVGGRGVPAVLAGVVAVAGLWVSSELVRSVALGNSEGLLIAAVLVGIDRHLDGRPRQTLVMLWLAGLVRPEFWLFLGLYGLWLWFADPGSRVMLVVLAALIPVLWFLPELWGSGNLLRSQQRAQQPNHNSAAFCDQPWLCVLKRTRPVIVGPIKYGAALAVLLAALGFWRLPRERRRFGIALALALAGVVWILVVAAMTQAGFSGNPRYLLMGTSLLVILGGVGFGWIARGGGELVRRRAGATAAVATSVVIAVVAAAATWHWGTNTRFRHFGSVWSALRYQAALRFDLERLVDKAGGHDKLNACGQAVTGKFEVPLVAWNLDVHSERVSIDARGRQLEFQSRSTRAAPLNPPPLPSPPWQRVADAGTWHLFSTCPNL